MVSLVEPNAPRRRDDAASARIADWCPAQPAKRTIAGNFLFSGFGMLWSLLLTHQAQLLIAVRQSVPQSSITIYPHFDNDLIKLMIDSLSPGLVAQCSF
jgi:hypothetical protein